MTYTVVWEHRARAELHGFAKDDPGGAAAVERAIKALAAAPARSRAFRMGAEGDHRLKVGRYRIYYRVNGHQLIVRVVRVG